MSVNHSSLVRNVEFNACPFRNGVLEFMQQFLAEAPHLGVADTEQRVHHIVGLVGNARAALSLAEWKEFAASIYDHPLRVRLLEDPFAGRCASKPRGYAETP